MSTEHSPGERLEAETVPAPDAVVCGAAGCHETDALGRVTDEQGRTRVLCPQHRKHFLGVSS